MTPSVISHYRIIKSLGMGGMGEVFLAEDTDLERQVAIKCLAPNAVGNEQAEKRLIREAKAAANLDHPNICAVHEVGKAGDRAFIVMQFIEGDTLSWRLRNAPPTIQESIEIVTQVAEALVEAHSRGVIHRDIKPQNLIITPRGQVKVLDFGLAKWTPERAITDTQNNTMSLLTDVGMVVGTVPYMSPEQVRGQHVDARTDLFALGAVLYECVTGKLAFEGINSMDVCAQVIHVDPQRPSEINRQIPARLDRVIARALAKESSERYQSASEMLEDLRKIPPVTGKVERFPSSKLSALRDTSRMGVLALFGRGRRATTIAAVLGVVLALVLVAWFINRPASSHQPTLEARHWYDVGTAALRDGAYYQASKALENAVETDSKFVLAHARLAEAYAEMDYTDRSRDELLMATTLAPDRRSLAQSDANYLDAISATVTRNFETATQVYRKIVDQAPESEKASVLVDLGRSYEKNEKLDKATETYLEAARRDPGSAVVLLRLGIVYGRQQDLKEATDAFGKSERNYEALGNQEGITEVLYQRGALLNRTGRLAEARVELEKALNISRVTKNNYQQIKTLLQLSNMYCNGGDTAQAEKVATEAIDIAQANQIEALATEGLIDLGNAFLFRGDYDEADKYFKTALEVAKRNKSRRNEARATLQLGSLNVQRENPDEAVSYIEQAIAFYRPGGYDKDTARASILLGRAYRQKGNYDDALKIFKEQLEVAQTLKDEAQIAVCHQSIGILLTEDQEQYPEALHHIEQSSRIHESIGQMQNLGYDLMNLGTLLWQLGRYDEAQTVLQRSLSISNSPGANYKELSAWISLSDAQMALSQRRLAEAKIKSEQTLALATTQYKEISVRANSTLGLARALAGDHQGGKVLCQRAVDMAKDTKSPKLLADMLLALAEATIEGHDARNALALSLDAQARFERSGQHDSEWHALLIAARATDLAGDLSSSHTFASRANGVLLNLQRQWGDEPFANYEKRPDTQLYRKQLTQLLAANQ